MKQIIYIFLILATVLQFACEKDDGSCAIFEVPDTYRFEDSNGNSTVNFQGQSDRIQQCSELLAYIKNGISGSPLNRQVLADMFENTNGNANGRFSFTSSKQLKDKCFTPLVPQIENYFDLVVEASSAVLPAINGRPGRLNTGNGAILVDENGFDLFQQIEKALMGGVFYYQAMSVYMESEKQSAQNTSAADTAAGKYYTDLEHHWDEAFGYLSAPLDFHSAWSQDRISELKYWSAYSDRIDRTIRGLSDKLMLSFRSGRAAISAKDLEEKDRQIPILKTKWETIVAAGAIHHINAANENFIEESVRLPHLTQALTLIVSLRYNSTSTASQAEVNELADLIGSNLYESNVQDVIQAKETLSTIYGLEEFKDAL